MNTPIAKYWLDLAPRGLDHKTTEQLSALPDGRNYIALYRHSRFLFLPADATISDTAYRAPEM